MAAIAQLVLSKMAKFKNKEEELILRRVLGIQPILTGSFFTLLILTFLLFRYFSFLTCLWACLVGIGLAYVILCNYPEIPSLLFILYKPQEKSNVDSFDGMPSLNIVCSVCQGLKCQRHVRPESLDIDLEPWKNLRLHKAVDDAIAEFLDLLLENYVYHWYKEKLSSDERFVDELRKTCRFIFAVVFRRLRKIALPSLILDKLALKALQHLESYLKVRRKLRTGSETDFSNIQNMVFEELGDNVHTALHSKSSELGYQRQLADSLLPFLLPSTGIESRSVHGLFRELLVYAVFSVGLEKISEPDFVNQILLVMLDEESMEEPLEPRSDEVEALATFTEPQGSAPFNELSLTIPTIINTPSILYPFLQFMKSQGALNILNFCMTLEDFNKRSLAPDLTEQDKEELFKEARTIHNKYFVKGASDFIPFEIDIVTSLKKVTNSSSDQLTTIEMATPLYRAYEYVFDQLELKYLPLFHQSDKYFKIIFGTRDSEKPAAKPAQTRLQKRKMEPLGKKFVSSLKDILPLTKSNEDETIRNMPRAGSLGLSEDSTDLVHDNLNIEMPDEDDMADVRDMSQWVITIPKVAFNNVNGSKEMVLYVISVCESESDENMNRWDVKRAHHEFYVLHNKLREFHGLFKISELPPKRNSHLSSKQATEIFEKYRNSFKRYLQDLVRNPLTRGSALLYNFLSPDAEFSNMFTPDTVGQVAGKKLKSVATLLKKEKGQNLESFLHSFLVSTKPLTERNSPLSGSPSPQRKEYHVKNQNSATQEGVSNSKEEKDTKSTREGLKPRLSKTRLDSTNKEKPLLALKGITEYILYLAIHLFDVPSWCLNLLICFRIVGKKTFDDFVERYLAYKIKLVVHEYHLVPIINMFRDTIFFDDDPPRTDIEKVERRDKALKQLLGFFPEAVTKLVGRQKYNEGLATIFELLQHPQLNKQLAYTLLDIVILELFPETQEVDGKQSE